jgi:hypothetical protein
LKEIENIYLYCNVFFVFVFSFWSGLRNIYTALEPFKDQKRSHVVIWDWIQGFGSCHIYNKHRRVSAFIIDETIIQIGDENFSGCGFVLNQFINRCLEYIYF